MCGPFCFYKDYIAFIEGTNYAYAKPVQVCLIKMVVLAVVVVAAMHCELLLLHNTGIPLLITYLPDSCMSVFDVLSNVDDFL